MKLSKFRKEPRVQLVRVPRKKKKKKATPLTRQINPLKGVFI